MEIALKFCKKSGEFDTRRFITCLRRCRFASLLVPLPQPPKIKYCVISELLV